MGRSPGPRVKLREQRRPPVPRRRPDQRVQPPRPVRPARARLSRTRGGSGPHGTSHGVPARSPATAPPRCTPPRRASSGRPPSPGTARTRARRVATPSSRSPAPGPGPTVRRDAVPPGSGYRPQKGRGGRCGQAQDWVGTRYGMALVRGPAMLLATVHTTTSTAGLWAIVVVAVTCMAFWLVMVVGIAPRPDVRLRRGQASRALSVEVAAQQDPLGPVDLREDLAGPRPGTTGSDPAMTKDDVVPVPGPRQAGPPPATTAPHWQAAGASATRPPGAEKADMDTSTDDPGVQWTARTPAQRRPVADEGARTAPDRED